MDDLPAEDQPGAAAEALRLALAWQARDPRPEAPVSQQAAWAALGLIVVLIEDNMRLAGHPDDQVSAEARHALEGMMLDSLLSAEPRPGGV